MHDLTGLPPGRRFRCAGCGNLTRFDVETTERVHRFWHVDLAGVGAVEDEQRTVTVDRVTCRWCGTDARVEVIDAPGAAAPATPSGSTP